MNKIEFKQLIRRVINEEVEKTSDTGAKTFKRVPEVVHDEDYKEITPHKREDKSKIELLEEMDKLVKGINKEFIATWDDHDDISIVAQDLFKLRITPKWENNYCIEAFTRNEDRMYITGQTWEQVKEFVKINLKDATTNTTKAGDKVIKNQEDQTDSSAKGLPQKDKPKTLPLTNEPPKETKNKDKNYTEKAVKKESDLPEKPMQEVKDFKKQSEHKVADPVKLRKRKPDTKLITKSI